jgi:hypothetical protein
MRTKPFLLFSCLLITLSTSVRSDISDWEAKFWTEMKSRDIPWIWALSLHHPTGSNRDLDLMRFERGEIIDKLLAHPSPGAEALYWAALACAGAKNPEDNCRAPELLSRLMEIDGDNLYSFAIYFNAELADKTGMGRSTSEFWDWSHFDSWLERALTLDRVENYDFLHYSAMVEILEEYAQTEGVPSYLSRAPVEWRVAHYIIDDLVYPWHGSMMTVMSQCRMSEHLGRKKATQACRSLANKLLKSSNSIWSRSDALDLLAETHSESEPEFLRLKRESAAWRTTIGPVENCMDRFIDYAHKEWTINYDITLFIHDYESKGEIVAFQNLADSENWMYKDDASNYHKCTEIPELPDEELSKILGKLDPAWTWSND